MRNEEKEVLGNLVYQTLEKKGLDDKDKRRVLSNLHWKISNSKIEKGIAQKQLIEKPITVGKEGEEYFPRKIGKYTDVEIFARAMVEGDNVLLIGETGGGKTALVRDWCRKNNRKYKRVSLNGAATTEDLVGHYVIVNGETKWVDGVLTTSLREGDVICLDEINAASPEVLFVLNSVMDDDRQLALIEKDGEVVKADEKFRLVATCNPTELGYSGTKEMNEALLDRFPIVMDIGYSEEVESKILSRMKVEPEMKEKIKKFTKVIRNAYIKNEVSCPFSTRSVMNLVKLIERNQMELIVNRFKIFERKAVSDMMKLIFSEGKTVEEVEDLKQESGN